MHKNKQMKKIIKLHNIDGILLKAVQTCFNCNIRSGKTDRLKVKVSSPKRSEAARTHVGTFIL